MMQPGSEASRNDMKAYLTGVIQEKQTSIELKDILNQIKNEYLKSSELSPFEKANIRDAIRDYEIATKKPKEIAMVCIIIIIIIYLLLLLLLSLSLLSSLLLLLLLLLLLFLSLYVC